MPQSLEPIPVKPGFAARVEMNAATASQAEVDALKRILEIYPVIILPSQTLTYEAQFAFAEKFGPIDQVADLRAKSDGAAASTKFDRQESNEELDKVKHMLATLGTTVWHTDGTYKPTPAHLSMLYGITVTREGGETQFADLRNAYDHLPENLEIIASAVVAVHSTLHAASIVGAENLTAENREQFSQTHAFDVVRTIPESGRKTLFLSAHAASIIGLPVPQGRMILRELTERATAVENVYTHYWTESDLVIWDNRCTMHRLRPYKTADRRVMQRISTADTQFHPRDPASVHVPPEVFAEL